MNSLIKGFAIALGDHVNTDIHCSTKYMPGKDSAFIVEHAFEKLDPNFPAQAKALRESGKTIILVAGRDFGINSSREQAVQILRDIGVAVIVAPSFARAFFRNAINNGLALITAPTEGLSSGQQLCIDLGSGRITLDDQSIRQGTGLSDVLLDIVSSGGLLAYLKQHNGWPTSQGRMSLTP